MPENLLQKLEEKVMTLIMELESSRKEADLLRKEVQHLNHENSSLRTEREHHTKATTEWMSKIESIMELISTINPLETNVTNTEIAA